MLRACGLQRRDPPTRPNPQISPIPSATSMSTSTSESTGHTTWLLGSLGRQQWQQSTLGSQLRGQSFKLLPETLVA